MVNVDTAFLPSYTAFLPSYTVFWTSYSILTILHNILTILHNILTILHNILAILHKILTILHNISTILNNILTIMYRVYPVCRDFSSCKRHCLEVDSNVCGRWHTLVSHFCGLHLKSFIYINFIYAEGRKERNFTNFSDLQFCILQNSLKVIILFFTVIESFVQNTLFEGFF